MCVCVCVCVFKILIVHFISVSLCVGVVCHVSTRIHERVCVFIGKNVNNIVNC